jgi:hypothetical protein
MRVEQTKKNWKHFSMMKDARIKSKQRMNEILIDEIKRLEAQNRPWYVKLWGAMWGR